MKTYSGDPKDMRAKADVSVLVKIPVQRYITTWNQINEHIDQLEIKVNLLVTGAYAQVIDASNAEKSIFFNEISDIWKTKTTVQKWYCYAIYMERLAKTTSV